MFGFPLLSTKTASFLMTVASWVSWNASALTLAIEILTSFEESRVESRLIHLNSGYNDLHRLLTV